MATTEIETFVDGTVGAIQVAVRSPLGAAALVGREACAVICHPHPLYGGNMHNKVVTTLARTYIELGIAAVRFNFRGVGQSAGSHDEGCGEVDDLISVCSWVQGQFPGAELLLAGYSFGAAIVASGCSRVSPVHLTLIAPPIGRFGLTAKTVLPWPALVVVGGQDELVDADEVSRWARGLNSPAALVSLPLAGHFFHGELTPLRMAVHAELLASFSELRVVARRSGDR